MTGWIEKRRSIMDFDRVIAIRGGMVEDDAQ